LVANDEQLKLLLSAVRENQELVLSAANAN